MFIQKARKKAATGPAITLVEAPGRQSMLEHQKRYDVHLNGVYWGDLYFNLTGYKGYLPTPSGPLDIGERPISAYRQAIRSQNEEWAKQPSPITVPPSPMELARTPRPNVNPV